MNEVNCTEFSFSELLEMYRTSKGTGVFLQTCKRPYLVSPKNFGGALQLFSPKCYVFNLAVVFLKFISNYFCLNFDLLKLLY